MVGSLVIDGCGLEVTQADCILFVGRLNIDFLTSECDGSFLNLPVGDAVRFDELKDKSCSLTGCRDAVYDNCLFKPTMCIQQEHSPIDRFSIDATAKSKDRISFAIEGVVQQDPDARLVKFSGQITADYTDFNRFWLLSLPQPIPIRFAEYYLPLIEVHPLRAGATRNDLIEIMGPPDDHGGGNHPKFGMIPIWIRYTLPEFYLRFQIEANLVTFVTIMSRDSKSDKSLMIAT